MGAPRLSLKSVGGEAIAIAGPDRSHKGPETR